MKKHLDGKGTCNFESKSLQRHMIQHQVLKDKKEQVLKCDFCNKNYKSKKRLEQHKKQYCLENRDSTNLNRDSTNLNLGSTNLSDIKDPLFIMPKPKIELDWSWREKLKRERMAKVKTFSNLDKEKTIDSTQERKTLQKSNIPPAP